MIILVQRHVPSFISTSSSSSMSRRFRFAGRNLQHQAAALRVNIDIQLSAPSLFLFGQSRGGDIPWHYRCDLVMQLVVCPRLRRSLAPQTLHRWKAHCRVSMVQFLRANCLLEDCPWVLCLFLRKKSYEQTQGSKCERARDLWSATVPSFLHDVVSDSSVYLKVANVIWRLKLKNRPGVHPRSTAKTNVSFSISLVYRSDSS